MWCCNAIIILNFLKKIKYEGMTWYHGWHPWYFWWDSLDRSSASGLVRSYLLFISKYLDILISWKINQLRSLYHQSDKFPFLPNLLLIEAAINQFGLKLKLVFIKQEGGRGEGGPGCCSLYWAPPCHCIVGCSENLCWTMTDSEPDHFRRSDLPSCPSSAVQRLER